MATVNLLKGNPEVRQLFGQLDFVVCLFFLADFAHRLKTSSNRREYFLKFGWIDLLASIPAVDFARWGRMVRVLRIVRLFRIIRSARDLASLLMQQRHKSAILASVGMLLLTVFMGAVLALEFESGASSGIDTAEEALWWAIVTMTTVGYGDVVPVTTSGRILAGFMMVMGLCLLAILTGTFASWFTTKDQEELAVLQRDINLIKEKLEIRD